MLSAGKVSAERPFNQGSDQLIKITMLEDRCQKLQTYCRELIDTNRLLDCENRLAIAQLTTHYSPSQLQNLTQAMEHLTPSPTHLFAYN